MVQRARKVQGGVDGLVCGAIRDYQDFPPGRGLPSISIGQVDVAVLLVCSLRPTSDASIGRDFELVLGIFFLQIVDRFSEHDAQPVLFIEGRDDQGHEDLGILDGDLSIRQVPFLLCGLLALIIDVFPAR